jgi:hypothetical protein
MLLLLLLLLMLLLLQHINDFVTRQYPECTDKSS